MQKQKRNRKFKQLTYEERIKIETLLQENRSMRYIARVLKRSPNTISYELKKKVKGSYVGVKAHHKTYYRRYLAKKQCMKLALDHVLAKEVEDWIRVRWSPERIAGNLQVNRKIVCSKKAIYKYVKNRCLEHLLLFKGKKRTQKYIYQKGIPDKEKRGISERPLLTSSGHLEIDFIVSSHNSACLLVCVDRYTRHTWIYLLPNRKHVTVLRALQKLCNETKVISITTDNDIAFRGWRQLEVLLSCLFYFCAPYHSWEKGLVENTNRWIRVFLPKRTDFMSISKKDVYNVQTFLNTTPRQILGYTTAEMLHLQTTEVY